MKYSKQREMILQTLRENEVHPTADDIYTLLKEKLPNLSLGTVYRNLNQLAEAGEITKISGLDGSVHFDHKTKKHFHFICNKCNKIYDIPAEVLNSLQENIRELTGLEISDCEIVLRGTCKNCQKQK